MDTEKKQKYFVSRKNSIGIKCLACGKVRTVSVESLKNKRHSITINCPCTKTFEVDLEFRHDYRQKSNLIGSFRALSSPKERARHCVIADHSSGGLLLQMAEELPIKQDDRLIVSYRPDSSSPRDIERIISVRHYAPGYRIGGAFIDTNPQREARPLNTATA
jgi:hypothetical protein